MLVMKRGRHVALTMAIGALRPVSTVRALGTVATVAAAAAIVLAHLGRREACVAKDALRKNIRHIVALALRPRSAGARTARAR